MTAATFHGYPSRRGFALSEAVEALSEHGYVVLGPENAEEAATLLGSLAYDDDVENVAWRATQVLAAFPEGFGHD